MPHLGVLSTVYPDAAWQIFDRDCLVRVGSVIAPRGIGVQKEPVMEVEIEMPNGETIKEQIKGGEVKKVNLGERQIADVKIIPAKHFDIGGGEGKEIVTKVEGGVFGVMLDGRGRPLRLPEDVGERKKMLLDWFKSLEMYPERLLEEL